MKALRYCAMALLTLSPLLAACSSTTLSGSWKDPQYHGRISKVYLVGVAQLDINRRIFEDAFSRELAAIGVTGISSYQDLPPHELDSKAAIVDQLRRTGSDAILMARMTSMRSEKELSQGPGSGSYLPGFSPAPYYRNWDSFYERRYESVYEQPTVAAYQIVTIEATLYDAKTGMLLWVAQLDTVIESDLETLFTDFVKTVTKDLQKQGLL